VRGVGDAGVDDQGADGRACREMLHGRPCTGAAQKRFCVNTPATLAAGRQFDQRQVAPVDLLRMPASASAEADAGDGHGVGEAQGVA
jgi:hypothetical protein